MSHPTGTGRTHAGRRLIKASPHAIYRAFMTPEALAAWRPPEGMRARFECFEPREGGAFRMVLEYEGEAHKLPGKSSAHADIVHGRFGEVIEIEAAARSFLHHQVRSMVGCLELVGRGKWSAADLEAALEARDRAALGFNAPPDGLYFVEAVYPEAP